jgi:hypothetical protein
VDPGFISRILIFNHLFTTLDPGTLISDPGSRIKQQQKEKRTLCVESGIRYRDLGFEVGDKIIPDPEPGVKKGPDSASATLVISVADPDPYVFAPPGSGSVSQRCGSGNGSSFIKQK